MFGGTVNNATTVQAANFPSRVVNIGGAITLQGSYSVSVWRSGNTVYCKVHVDVSAPNGAYQSMGASMSTNHGSTSKTFVGDGGATPKRGSGDIQINFADSGAGTISGTIFAGFTRYLNSTYALTANFSASYPTSNIDSTVPKNNAIGNITYVSHVENIGWQSWVADGATSGTVGKKLQMETIAIDSKLVGLSYEVHVAEKGWMSAKTNGHAAGTIGQSLAIQAIKIKLTGNNASAYTLKYRAHVAEKGWMNWVNAGEVAGTTGQNLDMQAIEIKLIPNTYTLKITGDSGVESISGNGSYSAGSTAYPTYKIKTGYHVTSFTGEGNDAGKTWTEHNNKMGTINDTWDMTYNRAGYLHTAPNKVSIAYHINGGTVNSSKYSVNQYGYVQDSSGPWFHKISYGSSDDPYNATSFGLTKTGYTFVGWENRNTGTFYDQDTQYDSTQYYGTNTSNTTANSVSVECHLQAKWKINTYTVSINPNGGSYNGTTGITKINQAQGETVEINQIPTRKGYTFVGWTRSGSGSLHSGNSDNRSGITQYEKADADGTAYTNYKMNFNNTTNAGYAYPSIQYFSYGYTSGHTYRLSVDVRVNKSSGNEYAHIRHSAFVNNWVAPSTTVNYLTNGWEHRTVERTFTGTTSEQNGTSQNIYPFVEFYAGVAGGKTGVLDFDMKNLTIYDVTAGKYITSNYSNIKNGATVDVGNGDTTITAVWVPNNTIYYKAGKGGAVSRTSEPVEGYKDALGSYARVNTGYKFDGWYGSGVKVSSNANFVPGNPNNSLEQPLRNSNYGGEVLSYDSTNKIYTIKANASNMDSSWGSGVSPSIASNDIIPWGKYFTATFDVWSPIDAKIQVDINNATVDGVNASGNDNDTNRGGTTAISLKANTWTTVSFWYQNARSTNSSQAALRNYSSIGLIWDTSKGDQNFKIRNYQTMVSNNVVGSAREYEARFVPIPYQQTVRVRFENTDGSFTGYSQAYQANHNYDSTFEWEFPESKQYQSAKVSYTVTGAKSTDVTVYRRKYTVKALAKYQNKDGTWPSEYEEEYNKTYRYGEECPAYPQFVNTASDYNGRVSWKAFTVTENKVMKFDLALDKGSVIVKAYLNGVPKELDNDYFKFDYYVENKLIASQVKSVEDKKSYYKSNFTIKNITPIPGYHYDNKYQPISSWQYFPPVEDNTDIIDGVLNKDSGNKYILYISANTYTVNYNPNNGSGSMSPDTVTYNTAYTTKKNTFTRTGYTFTGWNEKANGSGTDWTNWIDKPWTYTYTHDVTLYAHWKPNTYTITYKPNGGSGSDQTQTVTYGTAWTAKGAIYSRTGYTMSSWNTKADGSGTKYTLNLGQTDKQLSNLTLYAQWTPNTYYVTYDANGGSGAPAKQAFVFNSGAKLSTTKPTRTGYTFVNWDFNGVKFNPGDTIPNGWGSFTLKAQWSINSYYLDLNGYLDGTSSGNITGYGTADVYVNGKLVADDVSDYCSQIPYGSTYEIKDIKTKTGHVYNGVYSGKLSGTMSASDTRVFLSFSTKVITATFHRNFNSSDTTTTTQKFKYGQSGQAFNANTWSRAGYTFLGWSANQNATSMTWPDKCGVADSWIDGNYPSINIYAVWSLNTYSISYNLNGGSMSGQKTSYNVNTETFTLPMPVKTGYTFTGWTGSNGSIPQTNVSIAKGSTGNKSYTANWKVNTYTNSIDHWAGGFKNQEGNNSSKSWFALRTTTFNKNYGETFSMNDSLATAIPNGFYLMGKFGTSSLEGTWKTYEKPYNITQPAKEMSFEYDYYPYDYSITYNLDGGTNNTANTSKYNVLYGVSLKNPTKTGYTFLGWYDNVDLLTKVKYKIDNDTTVNGNNYVFKNTTNGNTLNAFQIQTLKDGTYLETFVSKSQTGNHQEKYTHNRDTGNYTIRLKANGSTHDSSVRYYDVYLEKGKTYSISYNIEKCTSSEVVVKNLSFTRSDNVTGINEGANATFTSSDELYAKLKNRQTGNINLTAKWTPNTYTITYKPNGGSGSDQTQTVTYGTAWTTKGAIYSRTGYTMSSWNTQTDGSGTKYTLNLKQTDKQLNNVTLYAQWTPNTLTIRYHSNGAFGGNKYENGSWQNNVILDYEQSKDTIVLTERNEEGTFNSGLQTHGLYDYSWKRKNDIYMYKNGYIGTGNYNTNPNGSGIELSEDRKFNSVIELANYLGVSIDSKDNSIDLYPQWKAISYSIVYNGNGATSGSMSEQLATFDKNVELAPNSFSRKYTVTYNAIGGTVNAPNNVATSTFNGWEDRGNITFIDKNYSYNEFDAPYYSQNYTDLNAAFGFNKYNLIKHYFLYGKSEGRNPKDNNGKVGLYPNKATVKNMTITNGYKVNLYANWKLGSVTLPTPTRFGYKFLGWYTSAEGGTKITGATYTPTSNVTLYAHWKLDSYYIDYNVNDTGLTDRITDNLSDNNGSLPGKDTAVMLTDFALQNGSKYNTKYTFKEWNTKPDGSGQKFTTSITNDGSLCKPGETLTLYAQWDTTPTITGKDFYMLENMKPASDILTSGKGLDKNPIDHFPDNMKDVVYPVKGYTKNGTDISSRIKVDYVEYDGSKTATASIDTKKPGKYIVHYSLVDGKQTKKFTRTITVLSASTPVINAGDRYFNKGSFVTAEMLLSTITSGDRYDGDLTNKVAVLNMEQIAFNTVGNYELQYKVTNRSGKVVVKKVKVHILEYLTDNQADKDNKYRYIRKDCSTKNDYCMEYFKEDSKWVTNDELNNQIIDSLSKDKSEEAIKKYHFSQDDVKRSK